MPALPKRLQQPYDAAYTGNLILDNAVCADNNRCGGYVSCSISDQNQNLLTGSEFCLLHHCLGCRSVRSGGHLVGYSCTRLYILAKIDCGVCLIGGSKGGCTVLDGSFCGSHCCRKAG